MTLSHPLLKPLAISVALVLAGCQQPATSTAAPTTDMDSLPDAATVSTTGDSNTSIADRAEARAYSTPTTRDRPDSGPAYAQVISVVPVRGDATASHRECHDVEVTRKAPVKDKDKIAGTAIGAVVGGLVGNQLGGGRGRDLATIAGAVGGGIAGREIQGKQQDERTVTSLQERCRTVTDSDANATIVSYDIVYEYAGESHKARVADDPGERIALPVRSIN